MNRRTTIAAALLSAFTIVAAVGCSSSSSSSSSTTQARPWPPSPHRPGLPEFYSVPDPLPEGKPGDLIKSEQVAVEGLDGSLWRVMYLSESINGEPIAVTGMIAVPDGAAPDGGRRSSPGPTAPPASPTPAPRRSTPPASIWLANELLEPGLRRHRHRLRGPGHPRTPSLHRRRERGPRRPRHREDRPPDARGRRRSPLRHLGPLPGRPRRPLRRPHRGRVGSRPRAGRRGGRRSPVAAAADQRRPPAEPVQVLHRHGRRRPQRRLRRHRGARSTTCSRPRA